MKPRIDAIDTWRGVAILSVMAFHYLVRFAPPLQPTNVYGFDHAYSPLFELGSYGVQVFFVISGMVITMTLLRSRDALEFAFNRFARLYPAFLVCMSLTAAFVSLAGPGVFKVSLADYLGNLTMLGEPLGFRFVDGAYWSLVVEITFYAYVAAAWLLLKQRFWLGLIALGVIGAPAERINPHVADLLLIARYMPYFLAGMSAWFILKEKRRAAGAWLGLAALALYGFHAGTLTLAGKPSALCAAVVLGAICLLIASVAADAGVPLLAWIGRLSYSLYLIHQRVGVTVIEHAKAWGPDWLAIALAAGLCLGLAWASYTFVEKPAASALRALWRKRPARARVQPPTSALPRESGDPGFFV
ncbi:MAG TPA: acyltransferase [Phenylobacterium sp.]|uniref:acyltransferase family protein n=1 Tax=Phenylobacterium sp. TaxID=1871053 RepID=UPI002B48DCA1|nr:acyltransferase [Phenylobacterium sp.]HKR89418.1 acyltransferase [Phenylobacterium sp.]